MTDPLSVAALVCTGLGLLAGLATLVATRDGLASLRVALELWTAAGLLRLSAPPSWHGVGAAAGILAVRQLVKLGLRDAADAVYTGAAGRATSK